MATKEQNTISIGFEDKIWKAADVLRGNLNAAEYEGVVLGLIFLKYISDKFDEKDLLGRTYEYCLQKFASMEGKDGPPHRQPLRTLQRKPRAGGGNPQTVEINRMGGVRYGR